MKAARADPARGQPVIAMGAVLLVWVLLRLVFWQSPLMLGQARSEWAFSAATATPTERSGATGRGAGAVSAPSRLRLEASFRPLVRIELARVGEGSVRDWSAGADARLADRASELERLRRLSPLPSRLGEPPRGGERRAVIASGTAMADPVFAPKPAVSSRWMLSSWFFWRDDSPGGGRAATVPNYGRSQAGAVLAYQLAPDSAHRPQVFSRATTALEGPREADLAVGLSARPLPDVPLRVAGEARLSLRDGATELRPAAYVVTELPPFSLPMYLVGDAYAQGGWVGGDFATFFVDAQLRINRQLTSNRNFSLFAGGGAWGGAQEGSRRLDIGPSASVSFRLGDDVYGRLSADYRVRVAGNAAPASGPALTLSAGF